MQLKYDLHSHSIASDGSLSPEALVERAKSMQVDVLALTDHDGTDGLSSASAKAQALGISFVPGVEISVSWNGLTLHILGLGINAENSMLQTGLHELRTYRDSRAVEIARQLEKHGIRDALEGAQKYATGALIGRTHFAHYLVEIGKAKDVRDVFKRYLIRNKPGYVTGRWASLQQAIDWIKSAGGQAVIAHPARYKLTLKKLRDLVGQFGELGGEGIEVVSSSHSANDCVTMGKLANQFNLLASCGSDFHGPEQRWAELGKISSLPDGCTPIWEGWSV